MISTRVALVWSLAERYASMVLSLAASMVIARLLTPADVGLFSLCAAAMAIAGVVREFGVGDYIMQEKDLDEGKLRNALAVAMCTAWSIGALFFIARGALATYYGEKTIEALVAVLTLNFVLLPFASPAYAMLNRELALKRIFAVQLSSTAAQTAVSVGLAAAGFGAFSLAWGSVAGMAMQVAAVALSRRGSLTLLPKLRGSGAVFRFGALQIGGKVIDTVTHASHEFIIARQFGMTQVGLFSRAKGLTDLFQTTAATAVHRVAVSVMATAHRADQPLVRAFARGTAIYTSIAWPFYAFLAISSPEIVRILFGPQWDHAGQIASILAISMMPMACFAMSTVVLAATGQVKRRLSISLKWAPLHVLGLIAASFVSLDAIAAVWFFTFIWVTWLYAREMRKLLKVGLRDLFADSRTSAIVLGVTAALQLATMLALRAWQVPALPRVLLVAVVGALVWYAVARRLEHPAFHEVERLLQRFRRTPTRPM